MEMVLVTEWSASQDGSFGPFVAGCGDVNRDAFDDVVNWFQRVGLCDELKRLHTLSAGA